MELLEAKVREKRLRRVLVVEGMHGVQAKYFMGMPPTMSQEVEARRTCVNTYPILGRHNDTISHDLSLLGRFAARKLV